MIIVTQVKSGAHAKPKTRGTLRALGLGRLLQVGVVLLVQLVVEAGQLRVVRVDLVLVTGESVGRPGVQVVVGGLFVSKHPTHM